MYINTIVMENYYFYIYYKKDIYLFFHKSVLYIKLHII